MSTFKVSHKGIGQMLVAPWLIREMHRRAEAGRVFAEAAAPVETGEYKLSFEVDSGVRPGKVPRAFGRLSNTSGHARFVEFGAKATPKYRILGRSLDHMR